MPVRFLAYPRQRIGLLGGSFNPAHAGHLHLSREALKRLNLSAVWWLVTPQNPLKKADGLAAYEERLAAAEAITAHDSRITVTALEQALGTRYTVDTLKALRLRYPEVTFVWLMGADNLAQFHRWRKWPEIMKNTPVAVFDRAPYSHRSLRSKTALRFAGFRLQERGLVSQGQGWCFISMRKSPESSTEIRKILGKK